MSAAPGGPAGLALRLFDCLSHGDARGALDLMVHDAPFEIVPAGVRGSAAKEGRRFIEELIAAFPDLWIQMRSVMETPDVAVVEVKMEGTQAADFLGVVNQEKHVDVDQAWMVWARGGRITGVRAYFCQNQLYRRLAVKRLDRVSILEVTP